MSPSCHLFCHLLANIAIDFNRRRSPLSHFPVCTLDRHSSRGSFVMSRSFLIHAKSVSRCTCYDSIKAKLKLAIVRVLELGNPTQLLTLSEITITNIAYFKIVWLATRRCKFARDVAILHRTPRLIENRASSFLVQSVVNKSRLHWAFEQHRWSCNTYELGWSMCSRSYPAASHPKQDSHCPVWRSVVPLCTVPVQSLPCDRNAIGTLKGIA